MATAPRVDPLACFTADQWAALKRRSSWRGVWLVVHCWSVIGLAMVAGALWPWTIPIGVVIVGTRQLGFFILTHDAAHALLHADRRVNDRLGAWFCSPDIHRYRPYHLQHHRFVQQVEDPDLVLSAPFPISRASFARKVLRDLTGQTFVKLTFGHVATRIRRRAAHESPVRLFFEELAKDRRMLIANGLGFALFAALGYGWLWLVLWLLPKTTWLQLVFRIRNIAEHALLGVGQADPLRQARTTRASLLERALLAPYWVNYHGEHHLFTAIACWNLPRAHDWLARRGTLASMEVQPGYLAVLRLATAGR